ncbi:MAG: TonB-dependent receptor [Hyphomicrobiaceae bacterium]
MGSPLSANAQTTLPGIVVTSPSPVARPAPASAPSQGPAGQVQTSDEFLPPPGVLIVADDTFVPVTVVTDREIQATQGPTITDTLQQKPGIAGSTFGAGANRPIIRGLDNARVRVQENGIGTHDVATLSEDHAVPVDPNSAKRVEVIRGPATLRYGSQAIGGVVAIENDRIPSFVPEHGFTAEMIGGLSSVDEGHNGAFSITAAAGLGLVVHADGFVRRADDYDTPNGEQFNTFVESQGFSFGLSKVWNRGYVGVSYTRITSLYGIPGEEAAEARPRIDLVQDKVQAKGEFRIRDYGIEAIRFWFGASDYAHNEVIFEEGEGDIVGTRFTNRETEARVEVQHSPIRMSFGTLRGAIGVQGGERDTRGFGVEEPVDGLLDPAKTRTIAGFLFEELQVTPRLRLQAAGRVERSKIDGTGLADFSDVNNPVLFQGEQTFTPVSGSIGALYEFPLGVVARLTLQHVERAPEAQELYSKGVHEATETFEIGNPFLEKEKANSVEVGLKKAQGRLRFDGSLYYTRYDSFIFKQLTGVECGETLDTCGVEDELDQIAFQQRKATFYGFEMAAQFDVAKVWRGVWGIDAQYDFVRAEFEDDNVPRIPPHRLGGGLYYRDANLFARVGVLHAFDQDDVNAESNELETPGYTLVSAELSYTQKLSSKSASGKSTELTIGIKGENLADDEVLNHSSFKRREEVLLPGASVKVFGKVKFN